MLIPSRRLLWLVGALAVLGVGASIVPELLGPWLAAGALLLAFAAIDAVAARRIRSPAAKRIVPGSLPLGVEHEVALRLANESAGPLSCEVHDHYPAGTEVHGLPQRVTVPARGWAEVRYRLRPVRRGPVPFGRAGARPAARAGPRP